MAKRLDPIRREQNKKDFAVFDIETMNWTRFVVLGFFDGETYLEFRKMKSFCQFINKNAEKLPDTIFAHFGGKFDFLFLLKEILSDDESLKLIDLIPRGSGILSLQVETRKTRKRIFFRDSSALLPSSLKSLTENFEVKSLKKDYDHTKTKGYTKELSKYLEHDCRGLFEVVEKFQNWPIIKKAGLTVTMAGQAMRVFRTFIKEPLYAAPKSINDFCRKGYLGGRVEIFKPFFEKGKIFEYDVNSLYPFVMKENLFPIGQAYWTERMTKRLGIFYCHVKAPLELVVPVLGIIRDGKYIFPVGQFEGVFTSSEISYARSWGYRIDVKWGYEFARAENIFSDFVSELYEIKKNARKNSVDEIIAKLLLNSCYGRFGMNPEKENIVFEAEVGAKHYMDLKAGKKWFSLFKKPITLESFCHVPIAAFVTSYARIHMHRLMMKVGPSNLYYTDTDSIWTDKKIPTSDALGDLKLCGTYRSAVFLLPKAYMAEGEKNKIALKGFDRKKIQDFQISDFHSALEGDMRRFRIKNAPKFATLKQALKQKEIVAMTKGHDKVLRAVYDKRIVTRKNGLYDTKPITVEL